MIAIYEAIVDDYIAIDKELKESTFKLINMMSEITSAEDYFMISHSYQVAYLAKEIGKKIKLSEEELEQIYFAALLHDIGKVYLDSDILNKKGSLTEDEYNHIKEHSDYGYNIVKNVPGLYQISLFVRHHHERYDGTGYPDKLKGDEIPIESRIICVADAVDAMTSHRGYRTPRTIGFVVTELLKNKGKQFDPNIVDIMISMLTLM